MYCGTASFKNMDNDEPAAPSSPKASKKKANKNPYSTRGLDKYSTVLGDLEARKAKIMEKAGSQGVSMVKFAYSNSSDWIPVVVRRRGQTDDDTKSVSITKQPEALPPLPPPPPPAKMDSDGVQEVDVDAPPVVGATAETVLLPEQKVKKNRFGWCAVEEVKGWVWRNWKASYYWPLALVLVLSCLVMFGRVFAICCMLIWWYLVPMEHGEDRNTRRSSLKKNKDYGRRMSSNTRLGGSSMVAH